MKHALLLIVVALMIACNPRSTKNENHDNKNDSLLSLENKTGITDESPIIEIVFCLDATGSMEGLIHTAKEKIWDIVGRLSESEPSPIIRVGFVYYRDWDDDFMMRSFPLSEDMDSHYKELLEMYAYGGGDDPEMVTDALELAVDEMLWSEGDNVYKTIFLVGDCPSHTEDDDTPYEDVCEKAKEKGIYINTIKLGEECTEAIVHFKTIASFTGGRFQQMGQDAPDPIILTPYDDSIQFYSHKIDSSKMYYGGKEVMVTYASKLLAFDYIANNSSANAIASRASYNLSESGQRNSFGENELIYDIMNNGLELDSIPENNLPLVLQELSSADRVGYIDNLQIERAYSLHRLSYLVKKREEFQKERQAEYKGHSFFSFEILKIMQQQAQKMGIYIGY